MCSEENLKALENGYVWLTTADNYTGDLVDSTLLYDTSKQRTRIGKVIKKYLPGIIVEELKKHFEKMGFKLDKNIINEEAITAYATKYNYKSGYPKFNKIRSYLLTHGVKLNAIVQYEKIVKNIFNSGIIERTSNQFIKGVNSLNKTVQGYYYVSSFTTTYRNNQLWENYADKRKGFCVSYDLSLLEKFGVESYPHLYALTPMFYSQRKETDISKIIDAAITKYLGNADLAKIKDLNVEIGVQIRNKDPKYNGEDEWRLFLDRSKFKSQIHSFPFTKAVYAGESIDKSNLHKLKMICIKKSYFLYQQRLNDNQSEYLYDLIFSP